MFADMLDNLDVGTGTEISQRIERAERTSQSSRGHASTELRALRAEVGRLRASAQCDTEENENLTKKVELLKAELRNTLDENRTLSDLLEERQRLLSQPVVRDEAVVRESALGSAKELFRSMMADAVGEQGHGGDKIASKKHATPGHAVRRRHAANAIDKTEWSCREQM